MNPFLTIVTRACLRPKMLAQNIESVLMQTDPDVEQIFLPDLKKEGIQAADKRLADASPFVSGEYVYVCDDDCLLLDADFVKTLKENRGADILFVKSKRPPGPPMNTTIVPTVWQRRPTHGTTNCLCYVAKARLWKKHISHYGRKPWGGDWWFLEAMLSETDSLTWIDRVVAEAQQLGRGRIFEQGTGEWWKPIAERYKIEALKGAWRLRREDSASRDLDSCLDST